jgi:hypothetical protein
MDTIASGDTSSTCTYTTGFAGSGSAFPLIDGGVLIRSAAVRRSLLPLVCAVVASACGPGERDGSGTGTSTGLDAAIDGSTLRSDSAAAVCYDSVTEVEVDLTIQIQQSCAIWNSLSELSGRATITRTGSTLTIDFGGGVVFSGTLVGNTVNLRYEHQHPFTDGCGWKATETLVGQLDPATCKFSLSYDYAETVVTSDGSCASPCSAMADVQLELTPVIL